MGFSASRICAVIALVAFAAPAAKAASVKELFERYGLIGTWAFDCSQPASEQNPYIFYRLLDADHVARDTMNSPTNRINVSVADFLIESNPNEVVIGVKTERGRTNLTVRLERTGVSPWIGKPIRRRQADEPPRREGRGRGGFGQGGPGGPRRGR